MMYVFKYGMLLLHEFDKQKIPEKMLSSKEPYEYFWLLRWMIYLAFLVGHTF